MIPKLAGQMYPKYAKYIPDHDNHAFKKKEKKKDCITDNSVVLHMCQAVKGT